MLIADPQIPLPEDAAAFREATNAEWARLQDRRAELLHRRAELDAAAPETMDKNHIRRLKDLKASEAEVARQQIPLLRHAAQRWPGYLKAAVGANKSATEDAYKAVLSEVKSALAALGFADQPGYITTWYFAHQNPRVIAARVGMLDAQQARPQFNVVNIERDIANLEAELRRAVEAAA